MWPVHVASACGRVAVTDAAVSAYCIFVYLIVGQSGSQSLSVDSPDES